jgi:hypothetical protein
MSSDPGLELVEYGFQFLPPLETFTVPVTSGHSGVYAYPDTYLPRDYSLLSSTCQRLQCFSLCRNGYSRCDNI